jgi:hypothetical protein
MEGAVLSTCGCLWRANGVQAPAAGVGASIDGAAAKCVIEAVSSHLSRDNCTKGVQCRAQAGKED